MLKSIAYATVARISSGTAHQYYVKNLTESFRKAGVLVTIFAPIGATDKVKHDEKDFISIGTARHSRFDYFKYAASIVFKRYRSLPQPEVWITHHPLLALAFVVRGVKWFYDVHQVDPRGRLLGLLLRHSNCIGIIYNSQAAKTKMERMHKLSHLPSIVSNNAIDAESYLNSPNRSIARKTLGLSESQIIFMYVGSLGPHRGIEQILKVALETNLNYPGLCSWIIVGGNGKHLETLQKQIHESGCGFFVKAVGAQPADALPMWYSAADCLLAPYSSNLPAADVMNPMKLYEYSAAGKPIIVSDMITTREALVGNEACMFYEPDSVEKMCGAVSQFMSNQTDYTRAAESFKPKALSNTWDTKAVNIIAWINEVCR